MFFNKISFLFVILSLTAMFSCVLIGSPKVGSPFTQYLLNNDSAGEASDATQKVDTQDASSLTKKRKRSLIKNEKKINIVAQKRSSVKNSWTKKIQKLAQLIGRIPIEAGGNRIWKKILPRSFNKKKVIGSLKGVDLVSLATTVCLIACIYGKCWGQWQWMNFELPVLSFWADSGAVHTQALSTGNMSTDADLVTQQSTTNNNHEVRWWGYHN